MAILFVVAAVNEVHTMWKHDELVHGLIAIFFAAIAILFVVLENQ